MSNWVSCFHCKVSFGLTAETEAALRQSSQNFYCPWGHTQHFPKGETETDKLRRERDRLKQNQAWYEQRLADERQARETAERRTAATRGVVTKLKKRAAAGVCPCCNRQFVDLQRHVANKHAGFVAEEILPDGATVQ